MKKKLQVIIVILLFTILLILTISTISIFLKWPMYLSGYSSALETQYNPRLVVLAIVLFVIALLLKIRSEYLKTLLNVNALLAVLFLVGQSAFTGIQLSVARKNNTTISFLKAFNNSPAQIKPDLTESYFAFDGKKQLMDIYYPKKNIQKNNIAMVLVHGGGFIEGDRTQIFSLADIVTQKGYTAFSIDYPLATDSLHTWEIAANSVATSMSYIAKNASRFDIDSQKIILIGGSAGGGLVMQVNVGLRNGLVKSYIDPQPAYPLCVIALYPAISLYGLWEKMIEGKTVDLHIPMTRYLGGSPKAFPERFKHVNLIDYLDKGISPTLITSGDIDHVVNIEPTRLFVKKAIQKGYPVSLIEFPYGEHAFDSNPNTIYGQVEEQKISEFLEKYK